MFGMHNRFFATWALAAALVAAAFVMPASAACLSGGQARQAVNSGQALRAGAIRGIINAEIIGMKLCRAGGRLVYRVTVLKRNGKVGRIVIDAASGRKLR